MRAGRRIRKGPGRHAQPEPSWRRRRDLNPRTDCSVTTLAGWRTRPDYATSPRGAGTARPRVPVVGAPEQKRGTERPRPRRAGGSAGAPITTADVVRPSQRAATRPSATARGVPGRRRPSAPRGSRRDTKRGATWRRARAGLPVIDGSAVTAKPRRQPVAHDHRPGGMRTCQRRARARCACASWASAEPAALRSCRSSGGGGRGIRTPGALPHNGFQDRHIRPLCQPSSRSTDVRPPRRPSLASRQLRRGSRPWSDYLGEPAGVSPELPCRPAARAWRAGPAR